MPDSDWTNSLPTTSRSLVAPCLLPRETFFQGISSSVLTAHSNYWLRSILICLPEINACVNANVICYFICNGSRRKTIPSANSVHRVGVALTLQSLECNSIPLQELPTEMRFWNGGQRTPLRQRSTPIPKFFRSSAPVEIPRACCSATSLFLPKRVKRIRSALLKQRFWGVAMETRRFMRWLNPAMRFAISLTAESLSRLWKFLPWTHSPLRFCTGMLRIGARVQYATDGYLLSVHSLSYRRDSLLCR